MRTKKNEQRKTTRDYKEGLKHYTAQSIVRKYFEDFADKDTGEITQVERSEMIVDRGIYIDEDVVARLEFFKAAGEDFELVYSDQRRLGIEGVGAYMSMIVFSVQVGKKTQKIIAYADCMRNGIACLIDYLELTLVNVFSIVSSKVMSAIPIVEEPTEPENIGRESEEDDNMKASVIENYLLTLSVAIKGEFKSEYDIIVWGEDIENAKENAEEYILQKARQRNENWVDLWESREVKIMEAKKFKYDNVIDYDFCKAYKE